jgi:hypothetical protein
MSSRIPLRASPAVIQKYLVDIRYPVEREKLVEQARQLGAPDGVLEVLSRVPERAYHDAGDVAHAIGEGVQTGFMAPKFIAPIEDQA